MAQLPQEFLTRMQDMLGDEFDAFLTSYDAPRTAGLRVNTKKCRTEDFPPLVPGTWKKIPWIPNGYFVPDGMRMGQSPLYAAGRLLSAGAKRHDPGVPPPDRTG